MDEEGEAAGDDQVVAEVSAGRHNKSGKGTEEASNTGIEVGGPEAGKEGHCRTGTVDDGTAGVSLCVVTAGALVREEDASVELEGDRGTLST